MKLKWIMIDFAGTSPSGKTNIYSVGNQETGHRIGDIRWHGPWRKYAFFPAPGCLFEEDCLRDIAQFLEDATHDHRSAKA